MILAVPAFGISGLEGQLNKLRRGFDRDVLKQCPVTAGPARKIRPVFETLALKMIGTGGKLPCYEITLVGYPQRTIADHGCSFLRLYVGEQMSGMTVAEVLDLNFEAYKVGKTYEQIAGLEEQLKAGTLHLAKVLLFINSESVRRQDRSEESDLVART